MANPTNTRSIYLVAFRETKARRAHFSVFVPSLATSERGTLIHVVGTPMSGFGLEFKRNYSPAGTKRQHKVTRLGDVPAGNIVDFQPASETVTLDVKPKDELERIAARVAPPGVSKNFLGPVDGVS
jgi:hypothetical protein